MKYPKEHFLIVRPSLKSICLDHKPSAKLLSLVLFYAGKCEDDTFAFSASQKQIMDDLLDEMDVRTLHQAAIPFLRILGYLDVDTSTYRYTYTVHLDRIQATLNLLSSPKQLRESLIVTAIKQLCESPFVPRGFPEQLRESLIELSDCLIVITQSDNCSRGRKAKPEAVLEDNSESDRIVRSNRIDTFVGLSPDEGESSKNTNEGFLVASEWLSETGMEDEEGTDPGQAPALIPVERVPAITHKESSTEQSTTTHAREQPTTCIKPLLTLPSKYKTDTKQENKKSGGQSELSPEEHTRRQRLQAHFNARRGGELMDKRGPRIEEAKCVGYLVDKYTDEELEVLDTYLTTEEPHWKKPANRVRVNGIVTWEQQQTAAAALKQAGKWPGQKPATPTPIKHVQWQPNMNIPPRAAAAAQ